MNYRIVCRFLGVIALLISGTMLFSLPWAWPEWGTRLAIDLPALEFESRGFYALCESILICAALGLLLIGLGGRKTGVLYHKESMAVVGFAWILATVLGALPFWLSGTIRGPSVRVDEARGDFYLYDNSWLAFPQWSPRGDWSTEQQDVILQLTNAGVGGLSLQDLDVDARQTLDDLISQDDLLSRLVIFSDPPEDESASGVAPDADSAPAGLVRLVAVKMSFIDAMFESQSGFSTTGATVISDLEDPRMVPHCVLFWRSSTHFLGGLGIIVLFVVILGQGSAGKALMRNEVPGPSQESSEARMQHTAQVFAAIYVGLTAALAVILKVCGLSWFDALCHSFGTMATGGFSTYNASLGHFDSGLIDGVVIVFMLLAGMNFTLLYFLCRGNASTILQDIEWRTYIGFVLVASLIVVCWGYVLGEFTDATGERSLVASVRFGLFQVVSIITTTGYGTHDFDNWNSLSKCILFLLMFVGGCAGSTGGGMKVIRWVLVTKILAIEFERAHRPRVVRTLRLGGKAVDDQSLRDNILVYFVVIGLIFLLSWLIVVGVEPDTTWSGDQQHKLIDSASAVAATLNNIGPGLGTVGATQNYGHFSPPSKVLFTILMMLGRVEVFAILVLLMPSFWRSR